MDLKPTRDSGGYLVEWDFTVNSTIVEVQNYWPLQLEEHVDDLKNFLQEHNFDIAIYMNPHPRSYFFPCDSPKDSFATCLCLRVPGSDRSITPCNVKLEGDLRGPRSDTS